mmetsp:Transcript_80034/g.214217  ORF Transcript_80034/g.214217 Transcript_80034/m.214217 type:complete len:283 (-) Transcript_80034:1008-1856(-)
MRPPTLGARGAHVGHGGTEVRQVPVVVERPEVVEELEGAHERLGRGGVHEVEVHQVVDAQLLEGEHHRPQVGPQHLGVGLLLQLLLEGLLRVEPEALAGPRASRTPRALVGRRLGDGRDQQRLDSDARVVHLLLAEAGVDDVDDAVDGERCLGDVGRYHDLAPWGAALDAGLRRGVEDLLLLRRRQRRVERHAHHWPHLRLLLAAQLHLDLVARLLDLLLAREEDEDVARRLAQVDLHRRADRRLQVVPLRLLGVEDLDGEGAARHVHSRAVVEVLLELARV